MADRHNTSDAAAFASALANLRSLQAADLRLSRGSQFPDSPDATDLLAAAEEAVLDLPAPDLSAVIQKLSLLWEFKLDGGDEESRHRQLVIGDLRRLAFFQT